MNFKLLLCLAAVAVYYQVYGVFVSNLNEACFQCLCIALTGCNVTTCAKGYCGPLYISRLYWIDADRHVLPEDDPKRAGAYEDCANQYNCAKKIVERYMAKFGKDCDNDHVTGCDDYAMMHYNGAYNCEKSLDKEGYFIRYKLCRQAQPEVVKQSYPEVS